MIISTTPRVFVNASRSLKTSGQNWVTEAPISIRYEYGDTWNGGVMGCSVAGDCYHLKFGGSEWTFVASFANGLRGQGNAGTYDGAFWVFGGKSNLRFV